MIEKEEIAKLKIGDSIWYADIIFNLRKPGKCELDSPPRCYKIIEITPRVFKCVGEKGEPRTFERTYLAVVDWIFTNKEDAKKYYEGRVRNELDRLHSFIEEAEKRLNKKINKLNKI